MRHWWWALLPLGLIAAVGDHLGWPRPLVFVLAGTGVLPAAALLSTATESLAICVGAWDMQRWQSGGAASSQTNLGAKLGGLVNATFGNIPELIIGVLALHQGYITLTKATIVGSVIGNSALVVGMALFVGGIRNGEQEFDAREAGHHAVLMALTVAGLALPSLFLASTHSSHITQISFIAGALLLASYIGYVLYSLIGLRGGRTTTDTTFIAEEAEIVEELEPISPVQPLRQSMAALAVATLLIFAASQALIDTVATFAAAVSWSPYFIGVIVVPILGNVAEHSSAVQLAFRNKMDLALGVASGSSIQVALFVTPLLVFASQFGRHLDIAFSPIELAVLALVVAVFFFVSQDGKSNWLEGLQLTALYAMAATVLFFVPGHLR